MTPAAFRTAFPEFASETAYPDSLVTFWLTVAGKMVSATRWGDLLDQGIQLFTAHNLVLERQAAKSAATGAVPGGASGPVNSKTVDKVSVSYDTAAAMEPNAGHWNLTTYGQRYIRLANMFGSGGLQF